MVQRTVQWKIRLVLCLLPLMSVIVYVQSGELGTIIILQAVTSGAGMAPHAEGVALGPTPNYELLILSPGCISTIVLQLHPELLVSRLRQLVDLIIPKPELLFFVAKPTLVFSPTPVKVLSAISKITAPLNNHSPVVTL